MVVLGGLADDGAGCVFGSLGEDTVSSFGLWPVMATTADVVDLIGGIIILLPHSSCMDPTLRRT